MRLQAVILKKLPLLILALGFGLPVLGPFPGLAATFDSSFLNTKKAEPGPSPSPEPKAPNRTDARRRFREEEATRAESIKAIKASQDTIRALTQLINNTPAGPVRNNLILNRAAALNLYVRQTLLASSKLRLDEKGKELLMAAVRDATTVLNSPSFTQDLLVRTHDILGFSYIYLDQPKEARAHFVIALKANPKAENAGWMALFVAEDLFDAGDYKEAANYYRNFYPQMNKQGREMALYKTGWCMINLNQNDQAEQIFARMVKANPKSGLGKDSIRDLAFLLAHHPTPEDALRVSDTLFPDNPTRIEFLSFVRASLESQNSPDFHDQVVERLLHLETNPENRLQLLLARLRIHRKEFASKDHHLAFVRVRDFMYQTKMTSATPAVKKFESVLDNDVQNLIRPFVEAFSGRVKTPEPLGHVEIGQALKTQLEFYDRYFPASPSRPAILNLWLDLCVEGKDWACVDHVADKVQEDRKRFAAYVERASVDQLAALEQLCVISAHTGAKKPAEGEPAAAPGYPEKRLEKLKSFIDSYPNSDQWLRVAKRYAELKVDEKLTGADAVAKKAEYREILPLLDQIYKKEKSPDSFYRLQWSRFQIGDYKQVLEDDRIKAGGQPEARLMDLKREASLALAAEAKKADDYPSYNRHIKSFLALNTDEKKAQVAREDFFRYLLKKEMLSELTKELMLLNVRLRLGKELRDVLFQGWALNMEKGQYKEALQLMELPPPHNRKDPQPEISPDLLQDLKYRRIISTIPQGQVPAVADLQQLSGDKRDYLLGVMVLTKPDAVLAYYDKVRPGAEADRDLAALALRMSTGQWQLQRSERATKLLGGKFNFSVAEKVVTTQLPSEKRIQKLRFPSGDMKPAQLAKTVQSLIAETQKIRAMIPKEIQGKSPDVQLRLVEQARDLEKRVGDAIVDAPIPQELAPDQVEDYKKGLTTAAKEFFDQSAEFEKLAVSFRQVIEGNRSKIAARLISRPIMSDWKWPSDFSKDSSPIYHVAEMAQAGNFLGALVLLDFFREANMKNDQDYFKTRAGLLLLSTNAESLRIYLLNELEKNKQDALILEWREMVKNGI